MLDAKDYPIIGRVARSANGKLTLTPMPEPQGAGILLLLERVADPRQAVAMAGGEVRLALDGILENLLNRPHPDIHAALDRGAVIDARFRPMDDAMDAAFTCHEIVSRRGPDWNRPA